MHRDRASSHRQIGAAGIVPFRLVLRGLGNLLGIALAASHLEFLGTKRAKAAKFWDEVYRFGFGEFRALVIVKV